MLAAAQRLRRREEFTATVRGGRRAGRGAVVVHLATSSTDSRPIEPGPTEPDPTGPPTPQTEPAPVARAARAGFVVSKAVGPAVVRNRVRRRLRHLVRERLAALGVNTDIVVRALPTAASLGYDELATDLDAALAAATRPRQHAGSRSGPRRKPS